MFNKIKNILNKIKDSKAFSLMEIVLSLMVVGGIMAAFTPVLTKKLTTTNKINVKVTTNCEHISSACALCKKDTCYACTNECKPPEINDTEICRCEDCGIEACKACASKNTCAKCAAGYYLNADKTCTKCAAGTYQNLEGQLSCIKCPEDYECQAVDGSENKPCLAGKGSDEGAATCEFCSAKIHEQCKECSNTSVCTKCAAGYYITGGKCQKCGEDQKSSDGVACENCPAGTGADAGSAKCDICRTADGLGRCLECTNLSTCVDCEEGTYKSNGKCIECPVGHKCPQGATTPTKCPAGYIQPNTGQATCEPCPSGTEANESRTACNDLGCDCGRYYNGGLCELCPAGSKCIGGTAGPAICASDEYAPAGSCACQKCTISACTKCNNNGACIACQSGYYLSGGQCYGCGAGKYLSGGTCYACPKDTYNSSYAATSCTNCPSGATTTGTGATSSSECQTCTAGQSYINGECVTCSEVYGEKCTACDSNGCTSAGCNAVAQGGTGWYGGTVYAIATYTSTNNHLTDDKWACAPCWDWWTWCLWCTPKTDGVKCKKCYDGHDCHL